MQNQHQKNLSSKTLNQRTFGLRKKGDGLSIIIIITIIMCVHIKHNLDVGVNLCVVGLAQRVRVYRVCVYSCVTSIIAIGSRGVIIMWGHQDCHNWANIYHTLVELLLSLLIVNLFNFIQVVFMTHIYLGVISAPMLPWFQKREVYYTREILQVLALTPRKKGAFEIFLLNLFIYLSFVSCDSVWYHMNLKLYWSQF